MSTLVQTKKQSGGGYSNTNNATFASSVTAGSLLVGTVTAGASDTIPTAPSGWTLIRSVAITGVRKTWMFYQQNAAGGTMSMNVTFGSGQYPDSVVILREYSGIATSGALDKDADGYDSGYVQTHSTSATAATTQANELVIVVGGADAASPTWAAGSGYGNITSQAGFDLYTSGAMADKSVSATGTQTGVLSTTSYVQGQVIVATFKEGGTNASATPAVVASTFSIPAITITAIRVVAFAAAVLAAVLSIPTPALSTGTQISPSVLVTTVSIPAPTITAVRNVTHSASVVSATFSLPASTTTAGSPLVVNLISYWKFDEASGNAADSHGSNTLTNVGTTPFVTGKLNNGADFEDAGSPKYFTISDGAQSGLDITGDFTISLWVNPESCTANHPMVAKHSIGSDTGYAIYYVNQSGTPKLRMTISNGPTAYESQYVTQNLGAGTFKHVVATFNLSTKVGQFFVNGASVGSTAAFTVTGGAVNANSASFNVGRIDPGGGVDGYFDGVLDEIGIWNRVLTNDEIGFLYNGGAALAYPLTVIPVNASATPSVLAVTASIPSCTVTAIRTVNVAPSVLSAPFSIPTTTVSAIRNVTTAPSVLSATFSVPAYSVITPDAIAQPAVLSIVASLPSRTIITDQILSVSVLGATFSLPAFTVSAVTNQSVAPTVLTATFSIPTPRVRGHLWENEARTTATLTNASRTVATLTNETRTTTTWTNDTRSI